MAPRTVKAKKNADVKVSEIDAPKKGRGKAKIVEPDQDSLEIVEEKVSVSEKKNKRAKNTASDYHEEETSATNKEEKAPPAKKGRKKNVEEPNSDSNTLNGDNSAEEDSATTIDTQSEDQSESNGHIEDVPVPSTKGRKKPSKKELGEVKPKESARSKKNTKQETVDNNKEEIIEEKPKGRGRSRKAPPKPEPDQEDDDEEEAKIEPPTIKGKKKGQQKAAQEKSSDIKKVTETKDVENENEDSNEEEKDVEEEKIEEEPKKKGRKNVGKKGQTKVESEDNDEEIKEVPSSKKKKGAKKEEKAKGDLKDDSEKDEGVTETKPKSKRGQKKVAEKLVDTEEVQDTGEPTTKRRRKADDKATEDIKKKPAKSATDYQSIDFSNHSKNSQGKEWNFKIASWNVDGIRAWMGKDGLEYLKYEKPDILCLQEVKCSQEKLPEEIKNVPGYHAYWLCSDKDGYAGVGIYTTKLAISVQYGLQNEELDSDGRIITAEYEQFYLICTYVPNAGRKLVTLSKRLKWNEEFRNHVKSLDKKKPVIICGDMNVAHNEIDLTNPKTNKKNAGFTDEERSGMTELLGDGFVDLYRHYYPDKTGAYTFWSYMFNSRAKNVGWRLDYFIVSQRLLPALCDTVIRDKVYGSDHCPISLFLHISSADKPKE
ncbi:DNA-(apurinic or apyrimidinic site) endonuclease [Vanessa atalanta]|uniref:DNA-(apurinic or apyrimidinic site) endonuclease n=1 Tax=Vanessa atalanta TaxID=42275 RepID=UPI001FCD05F2|nr:DNA-(apurinic or apyrimidinic site) endonuclease [Vanessa atalanta]